MNRVSSSFMTNRGDRRKKGRRCFAARPSLLAFLEDCCVTALNASTIPLPKKFVYPPAVPLQFAT